MEDLQYQKIIDHLILEELGNGKTITLRVSGKSMYPLIKPGDSIRIEKCAPGALAIGDIITFKKDGIYLTHRVLWVRKKDNGIILITKGDNEINVDSPVSPNHIVGKALAIKRANRTLDLESPFWRYINPFLGMIFLMETIFILFYRIAASKFMPLRAFVRATFKPSHLYRRLRKRGLGLATRMIG